MREHEKRVDPETHFHNSTRRGDIALIVIIFMNHKKYRSKLTKK